MIIYVKFMIYTYLQCSVSFLMYIVEQSEHFDVLLHSIGLLL